MGIKIESQRLRNLTTGILHTSVGDVQEDLRMITGFPVIYTHEIPDMLWYVETHLRSQDLEERFWNGVLDLEHNGTVEIGLMSGGMSYES